MDRLRTLLFSIVFFGVSTLLVLFVPIAGLFGPRVLRRYTLIWFSLLRWCTSALLGIRTRIEGDIPKGPVLFAAKHESIYEAMELTRLLGAPATVMKRELAAIPIWGWAARRYGVIVVDRSANAGALRLMMKDAKLAKAEGRSIMIFPEGTRVNPGESPGLRSGFAGLYRILGLPVVPVAVKSGHVWPLKGPKRPGTIIFSFGEPIPPGLPRDEIEALVHAGINRLNG